LSLELFVEDVDVPVEPPTTTPSTGYDWKDKNENDTSAFAGAYAFMNKLLIDSGVRFGAHDYQFIDHWGSGFHT
jgi:hypothetical protein